LQLQHTSLKSLSKNEHIYLSEKDNLEAADPA